VWLLRDAKSVVIEVRYKGQLGNNLFQYCLGRILATEMGYALEAPPIPGFSGTSTTVDGRRYQAPERLISGQALDVERLRRERPACRVVLHGWFQQHEYYRPHRQAIRQWLAFDDVVPVQASRPTTVVHVRRHDYVTNGWALPFSFYERALEQFDALGDLWILTDDPSDPFFDRFARWRPRFTHGSTLADLRFMSAARQLVMSQSTYSWWASFLGEPDRIVCPVPSYGAWSASGEGVSLIERDRFVCIDSNEPYRASFRERFYQQRRGLRPAVARTIRRFIPVPTLRRAGS
jgi:hypothetical protein